MLQLGLAAAAMFMLLSAIDVTIAKYVVSRFGKYIYASMVIGIGIIPMLAYLAFTGTHLLTLQVIGLSVMGSVFLGSGYVLYYKGLEHGQITNVSALGEIQPALLFVFGFMILGETINAYSLVGVAAIFVGAGLVMVTEKMKVDWRLLPAILANVSWAAAWIFMNYAIAEYGGYSLPLLIERTAGFLVIVAYSIGSKSMEKPLLHSRSFYMVGVLVLLSGILDGSANVFFGMVVNSGLVAVGSAIAAIMPIVVAALGRIVYGDRLHTVQKVGFMVAVFGAIAVSIW
jgi:drug/metabolite transporter (DMT)-like permease